ncbi:hypothetical protein QZH41_019362 [Actinostola sp. cb2023]|nr:hypothetical protein QZH41_019362 [Actinostola sp. cb2023]
MRKSHEDVPLEPTKGGASDTYVVNEVPEGMVLFTKLKLFLVALLIIILIVIIIILAACLGAEMSKSSVRVSDDASGGSVDKEGGDKPPTTSTPPTPPTLPSGPWDSIRLPNSIAPLHYDLHLNVDPNKDGFSGHEKIVADVTTKTSHILIHSNGLNITEATVQKQDIVSSSLT